MYDQLAPTDPLTQGEIIDSVPLLTWRSSDEAGWRSEEFLHRVILLTQACDLENDRLIRVQVALVHTAADLVTQGKVKAQKLRDQVRRHQVYGWYFLPACDHLPESVVDLYDIHAVPRPFIEELVANGHRVCRLVTPYREHLAQHFAVTYSRIGLPKPYETE